MMEFDTTNPTDLDSLMKVKKLWYNDADTVFCAGKCKFRLHSGIISTQSTIIRDNSALSPHGKGEDGIVIPLPDNEKDLYYFFLAIVDAS